ncbi:uncharacterized protein LOC112455066, partial [Temnothorax curvispinosus]|uniref:Uncharacterized protein LOC112455066 n=2 Tax=Temnothorax TaxID=300110 RepID=A0A6J1PUJ9_9HYME
MQQDRKKIVVTAVSLIVQELEFSSSESDDEELQLIGRNPRRTVTRIENYVEELIPKLTKKEFKAHFRMLPETCNYILSRIEHRLHRITNGTPMISPRTQFLLALWRMATPDSFR